MLVYVTCTNQATIYGTISHDKRSFIQLVPDLAKTLWMGDFSKSPTPLDSTQLMKSLKVHVSSVSMMVWKVKKYVPIKLLSIKSRALASAAFTLVHFDSNFRASQKYFISSTIKRISVDATFVMGICTQQLPQDQ